MTSKITKFLRDCVGMDEDELIGQFEIAMQNHKEQAALSGQVVALRLLAAVQAIGAVRFGDSFLLKLRAKGFSRIV